VDLRGRGSREDLSAGDLSAADPGAPRPAGAGQGLPGPGTRLRRPAAVLAVAVAGIVLFSAYLRMSGTLPVNSDGASNALQAWDMLHGNVLLRGWWLSDVSFYTTELPEYMAIELVRGLVPEVVHIAGALTYTLLLAVAALLARGRRRGAAGWLRMAVAAGIMVSPQLGTGAVVLLLSPDHVGSSVPVLVAWLVLDRAGRRWWVPLAVGAVLAWAMVADQVVGLTGIAPLLVVSAVRGCRAAVAQRRASAAWPELWLAVAAVAAAAAGLAIPALIHSVGGYTVAPSPRAFTTAGRLPVHLRLTAQGLLLLFGADFVGLRPSVGTGLVIVHLAGLALAAWGLCAGVRRFARDDIVADLLTAGTIIILAAYFLGTSVSDIASTREMAAVLPFGAVLAGRLVAGRLAAARLLPAAVAVAVAYLVTLAANALPAGAVPPAMIPVSTASPSALARVIPPGNVQLAHWLSSRGLRYGLAGYWQASSVTLATGCKVQVRPLIGEIVLYPYEWEAKASWYSPLRHDARFVVVAGSRAGRAGPSMAAVLRTFGQPAARYRVGDYQVLTWRYNLLTRLGPAAGRLAGRTQAQP